MSYEASTIMKAPVISISPEASLQEAIKLLAENKVSGLPVVDAQKKVVGIITEKDIVDYASSVHVIPLIGTSGWVSPHMEVTDMTDFRRGFENLPNEKVEKVMTARPVTVKESVYIIEVARLMKKKDVNRIPVVDEKGKLTGIITRADLVNYLAERED